uniref:Methyltranfer_dom domain-containing protein n=1 Tax=Syphacia muris TaxID=451379 RepID=A0A0N5AQ65_9BILA
MVELYVSQTEQRRKMLSSNVDFGTLYNVLVPEITEALKVYCPILVRVGYVGDGGKWICNPFVLQEANKCAVLSLGINNDITFDLAFQEATEKRCRLYALDKDDQREDVKKKLSEANGEFKIALLSGVDNPQKHMYTIQTLMKQYQLTELEILKIDIEGAEFQVMPMVLGKTKICQILIEIHNSAPRTLSLLKQFAANGYYLFSYEINGYHHNLAEYSFILDSCIEKYGAKLLAAYLR